MFFASVLPSGDYEYPYDNRSAGLSEEGCMRFTWPCNGCMGVYCMPVSEQGPVSPSVGMDTSVPPLTQPEYCQVTIGEP